MAAVLALSHFAADPVLGAVGSLLAARVHAQFGFRILDQLSADVHRHDIHAHPDAWHLPGLVIYRFDPR
jgi:hypothetical protein